MKHKTNGKFQPWKSWKSDLIFWFGRRRLTLSVRNEKRSRVAKEAGIRPIMITGDHQDTAEAIANVLESSVKWYRRPHLQELGLNGTFSDEEFQKVFQAILCLCACITWTQGSNRESLAKWKSCCHDGDGVNGAPSLKTADIGIGTGLQVQKFLKGASDMVLADDNFATIIVAVEKGRRSFSISKNLFKYLLSANGWSLHHLLFNALWMIVMHLLWINGDRYALPAIILVWNQLSQVSWPTSLVDVNLTSLTVRALEPFFIRCLPNHAGSWCLWLGLALSRTSDSWNPCRRTALAFATPSLIQLLHAFNVKSVYQSNLLKWDSFKNKTFNLVDSSCLCSLDDGSHHCPWI